MIPPLLMDVKAGMTVLDMCAAPGSKAAQLIEMVHGGEEARMRKVIREVRLQEGREASLDGPTQREEMEEEETTSDWSDDGRTTGLLIANDADYRRAHMLIHQMKRLNSPNLIVTNHDATMFPSIKLPSESQQNSASQKNKYLKFDRILADVPCSGDGTCRKNVNIWKDWNPSNALGLFSTQVRILVRALQMLKVGGRAVYSTCSMNPVENEAVVAAAINRCGGLEKVSIIDCSPHLHGLRRCPGLTSWKVMDKMGRTWSSWQAVEDERTKNGEDGLGKISELMFPPKVSHDSVPLERCMRVYAHLQDTGAFFITVLEKKIEIKARPEAEPKQFPSQPSIVDTVNSIEALPTNGTHSLEKIDALDDIAPPIAPEHAEGVTAAARQNKEMAPSTEITAKKRDLDAETDSLMAAKRPKFREEVDDPAPQGAEDRQVHWPPPPGALLEVTIPESMNKLAAPPSPPRDSHLPKKNKQPYEEPFKYLDPNQEDLISIYKFYEISPRFPRDRFMVRNAMGHPHKIIYYTSALARDILNTNATSGIKFVHCGVKLFVKQDVQAAEICKWRIQNEGMPVLEACVGESRVVRLWSRSTLRKLLIEMFPKVTGDGWKELGEIGERVRDIGMGCCVLRVETTGKGEDGFGERMVLPLWRSLHSLNLMLPKEDRRAMLVRLFGEDTPLQDHSKERFNKGGGKDKGRNERDGNESVVVELKDAADEDVNDEVEMQGDGEGSVGAAGLHDVARAEVRGDENMVDDDDEEEGGVRLDSLEQYIKDQETKVVD